MSRDGLAKGLLVPALILTISLAQWAPIRPASGQTFDIEITGFAFDPSTLTVREGDTVTWKNNDPVIHTLWTVKSSDGSTFDLSPPLSPGDTYSLVFPACGSFEARSFQRLWVSGTILVLIPGDVNGDNVVDIFDLVSIAIAFGALQGDPNYNPAADLNNDGTIDIFDLVGSAVNFAKVCPTP